ncbi:MAG: hypothetical protein KBD53_02230 [Candidatus Omnitrophica bacterium]|nr:hypothetical protein [Candidatus Omnitrophota bacterium]
MDNLSTQLWSKRKSALQSGHIVILDQLSRCKMGRRTPAALEQYQALEQVIISHLSVQSPDFYRALFNHLKTERLQIKVLEYLEFDLKALRIRLLEFMEMPVKTFAELSNDIVIRIKIEKEYLLPLLEILINQTALKQTTYEN